jgi:hypothetical protein
VPRPATGAWSSRLASKRLDDAQQRKPAPRSRGNRRALGSSSLVTIRMSDVAYTTWRGFPGSWGRRLGASALENDEGIPERSANCDRDRLYHLGERCRAARLDEREGIMTLGTILLIIVILALIGVLPVWPHARSWGYAPSGIVGVILLILLILFLMGRL